MTAPALRSLRLEQGGRDLLVLLPGAYMRPEDFVAAGFFEMVETHLPTLDLCAVDLDLAIISSGQALSVPFTGAGASAGLCHESRISG